MTYMPDPIRKELFDISTGNVLQTNSMQVLDEGEFMEFVTQVGVSRQWYVLITAFGSTAAHGIEKIERKYYPPNTEANDDFHILINRDIAVTLMRKNRMSRAEFANALVQYIGLGQQMAQGIRDVENRDLLPVVEDHPVRDAKVLEFVNAVNDYYEKQIRGE